MDREQHTFEYNDIIDLPHPTSRNHPRMSPENRAAQFAPFAALTGHGAAIRETARLTEERQELGEDAVACLDRKLRLVVENIETRPVITFTYFVPDEKKSGGAYVTHSGAVKRVDHHARAVILADETVIPIGQISNMEGELFRALGECDFSC
ncbi:MAG: hypothetical protein LUC32_02670 [Clostridiales bacterium]|nr:hypothetical protein [Clostridiales bacterium]